MEPDLWEFVEDLLLTCGVILWIYIIAGSRD